MTTFTVRYTKRFVDGLLSGLEYPTVESDLSAASVEYVRTWAQEHETKPVKTMGSSYTVTDFAVEANA